jgi:hypothetical protein
MKPLFYSALLALTMFTSSCSKEGITQRNQQNMNHCANGTDEKLRYDAEAVIFDQSGQYSVTYHIESNNKEIVKSMKSDLERSVLQFLDKAPLASSEKSGASPLDNYSEVPYDRDNAVHLTETAKNIGNAFGYFVRPIPQKTISASYSSIVLTVPSCNGIYVQNLSPTSAANYNHHYYLSGGTMVFDQMVTLGYNAPYPFSNGGFTTHKIISMPSVINGNNTYNNVIYWYSF